MRQGNPDMFTVLLTNIFRNHVIEHEQICVNMLTGLNSST